VILGLVGLCAIVGWRLRSRIGNLLYRLMVVSLIATALMGIALPRYIDNWGHAGGAIVGALLGFAHFAFIRGVSKPRAWGAGVLTGVAIALCGAAQVLADRRETPSRLEAHAIHRVGKLEGLARELERARRTVGQDGDVQQLRSVVALLETDADRTVRDGCQRLRSLLGGSGLRIDSSGARKQIQDQLAGLLDHVHAEYRAERRRLAQIRSAPNYRRRTAR
jgi:hypothetical protein